MTKSRMKIANLDEAALRKLRQMEEAMGAVILALEPIHAVADLTPEQLNRLRALEQELDVVLIAYRSEE